MKRKILKQAVFMSKTAFYGLVLHMILAGLLVAKASNGQKLSIDDIYLSIDAKNEKITQVLTKIERKTPFEFSYFGTITNKSQRVTFSANNLSLREVLEQISLQTGFGFKRVNDNIFVDRLDQKEPSVDDEWAGQEKVTVSGIVTSAEDQVPLPGVSIIVKGTSLGTITDVNGKYMLTVEEGDVLKFSYVGFQDQEVTVADQTVINITLETDFEQLEEIVVVGYGEQKKSLVTGAISSIKASELSSVSNTRVEQALQGRTAGVSVLPNSGSPGSGMKVRIRGTGSNQGSDPLYIIDGVRAGSMEYLSPTEIESIEVLKDAASAAIYGAEGANGVVIITTKTGKANDPKINYSFQYGQQSIGDNIEMMNAQQYQQYLEEANVPIRPTIDDVQGISGTNWFDEVFENAPQQRHSLTFSGGNDNSTYLVSGSYFAQEGIAGGDKSKFERFTVRVNSDHKIKPWLKIGERFSYSHFDRSGIAEDDEFGSVINNTLAFDPVTPVAYTDGLPAHVEAALAAGHPLVKNSAGYYYGISKYLTGEYGNPLARLDLEKGNTVQNKIVGNFYAELEPVKGLKVTSRFGIDASFLREHDWTPTYWFSSERLNTVANGSDKQENAFSWQWENFVTYQKSFQDHSFTFLAGMSAVKWLYNDINGSYSGLFKEDEKFSYGNYVPDDQDRIGSYSDTKTLSSYFGRVSYDYKGKYLFNATVRRDGSSLLSPGNQWGTFPSVSAGWVLSNESFYPVSVSNVMSHVKLRASWGQNGNLANLSIGQWLAGISTEGIRYPNSAGNYLVGASLTSLSNPDLRWETSEQIDVGVELGFFNDQLNVVVDYFEKTTKDLITTGTAPLFAGKELPFINGGDVQNKGWEFEVSYRNSATKSFSYEIAANYTAIKNEVTYLDPNVNRITGSGVGTGWTATMFEEGYPIWYFSGYKTDGIFQNQEEIDAYLTSTGITGYSPSPGDPVVVDVNKDQQISIADQTYIGSPHPDSYYGIRANVNFKGFDFLVFLQGQIGNDILMGFNRTDRPTANKPLFFYEDRWTGEGSTNSWFAPDGENPYIYNSDLMVFKGSYARVRQLQLGYTLPSEFTERLKLKNARVYVTLDNYFTFTDYPGLDPESGSGDNNSLGIDRGVYPVPRTILGGISVTF
ncbi:TonB-dependent receptor [Rapidithrix thailandica]|uniref:TonB-dependent receptor n=1 Tax=Rapidithrix thailandica TaxID=413964 RepID=A0AAW9RNB3_9BACT